MNQLKEVLARITKLEYYYCKYGDRMDKAIVYTAELLSRDVKVDSKRWNRIPSDAEINDFVDAASKRNIKVIVVKNKEEALSTLKDMIPAGSEVMNGSSTTLAEIGFIDYFARGTHKWKSLHEEILKENDAIKRADLRRKAVTAQYFIASINAIAKTGELVAADYSGSRVGAFPVAAKNLVLVSGINKLFPSLGEAIQRLHDYVLPLEDARMKKTGAKGSMIGKTVIISQEIVPGRITLILIKERLGF